MIKFIRHALLVFAPFLFALVGCSTALAQVDDTLKREIQTQDTRLFELGFNQCNFQVWNDIFGKEFEFYDDRTGLNTDRAKEVRSFKERCEKAQDLKRRLVSSRVSALGEGHALQIGEHEFLIGGKVVEHAKFIHIWQKIEGAWIVSRVVSYDHQPVNGE